MTVGKIIRKVPVVVGKCTGFAVNRTFFPHNRSAHLLVILGVDLFRIGRMISNFGLPMGPFQLQDLTGYGVALAVGKEFAKAFPDLIFNSPLVELLVKNGRNVKEILYLNFCDILFPLNSVVNPISVTDKEILEMILFPVVNEACRVLDEGIMVRASDLDIASVLGMTFPSYRHLYLHFEDQFTYAAQSSSTSDSDYLLFGSDGIVFWADTVGANHCAPATSSPSSKSRL
ncbi:hypothetical protein CRYUN_Cryun03dG0003400 [Craigia yunnanensis]